MVIIVGAGLSGLLTAYRLKKECIPFKILESRSRVGGRIHTLFSANDTLVELGATWFQSPHRNLLALLHELKLDYFEQYMDGSAFYQPSAEAPTQLIQLPNQAPSYRILGGTAKLIKTLYNGLDENNVLLNKTVKEIRFHENGVQVIADSVYEAEKVVLAIPPKLWARKILFQPQLPSNLIDIAKKTHTWMEDSIKVALTYAKPFWRDAIQSGALFSNTGPITEFYDHCNFEQSKYALCGFMSSTLKNLSNEERRERVLNQLKSSFGKNAMDFIDYNECIWSQEDYTFEESETFLFPHQNNGNAVFRESYYEENLLISSSEASQDFSGYMDGAVYIGNQIAEKIIKAHRSNLK
ncbi:flavin monoamine oxidase family protein [Bizionia myxarmorum]|uniref:NAD(P)-binding protein n=1 Tax=Bizionia myxarmorum TaxID=291186 RepID=A0A5D0R4B0_9FLAO|nr:FAD-dependent oxidoreductase [Bizionia myxarmorum]TYB76430.1 NAD(P)-binding protein [Bizionia myxarmorum]